MSQYGQRVVAVIDTASTFGATVKQLKNNVETLQTQMSTLLADAPETLDTLNEIAAAISDDPAFFSTMATANTTLQSNIDAEATTRTNVVAALQALIDAATTARGLLSGRLDTLEADPTTGTALAAVQADVDANEVASDAAEAALSGRLDTLEADPTTKSYVDTTISNLVDSAPGVLDTLNELAAAIGDDANFATTITNSIAAVQADVDQNETDADAADTALSNRIATLEADPTTATALAAVQADVDQNESDADAAIAAVQADVDQNEADADAAIALKFDKTGGQITGNLAIAKNWPDVELKSGDEKRILFADAGGHATAGLKHVSGSLDFYVGGIASGNKEMSLDTDGLDVSALKIDGTALSATAAEINAFDSRLDTLEADPTTATALAAVQADVDQNESDADAAIAAVQADVDQNEADADAAIALRALAADGSHTGTTKFERIEVDSDGGYFFRFDRNTSTQLDILTGNIPSGGNLNIKNSNGTDAKVVVYSDLFWVRNLGGSNGNGKAQFDGDVTFGGSIVLDGTTVTATGAELNLLDGVTATTAELNYVDGVTSNIQTQIDAISSFDNNNSTLTGTTVAAELDISGDIDVDGTANLDNVDIDGNTSFDGTITVETTAGSTDYSEVTLTNLSPSSFNETYGRQSTGFVLDTGTVASGNALFHADSNYYYYVATTGSIPNGRALIWSVEDNKWVTIFDMSGNFTEGNVSNNDALGSVFTDDVIATSQTQDGRSVPAASGDVVFATTSASGLTDAANDSAAATAGVAVGQFYRNGSVVMIRVS